VRNLLLTALVLALAGATAAAFVVAERLKLERSPVTAPQFPRQFSPSCDCPTDTARLRIRFRRADVVDARIVDRTGRPVRTLSSNERIRKGRVLLTWDGRDDAGAVVGDGKYRLELHLEKSRRTILVPTVFRVDTKAPKLRVLDVSRATVSPNGDGVNDRVRIVYRAGSKAAPILSVNGLVVVRGKARSAGRAQAQWNGRVDDTPAAPGEYRLTLQVRDLAGNLSKTVDVGIVRVRYLELSAARYEAHPGGLLRFRAATDALPLAWLLESRGGRAIRSGSSHTNAVAVRLPKRLAPGVYRLEVRAGGRQDGAVVAVRKAP
jgi:flagellar hook assembly protein FlgD